MSVQNDDQTPEQARDSALAASPTSVDTAGCGEQVEAPAPDAGPEPLTSSEERAGGGDEAERPAGSAESDGEPTEEAADEPAADVSIGEAPAGEAMADEGEPAPVAEITAGEVSDELKAVIEALVYASPDPLTPKTLFKVLESEPREDVQVSLDALRRDYADGARGLQLVEVAGGYQIVTRPELSEWVRRLFHERKTQKLSVAALETLAVVAYKQPITAPEITEIRAVNTSGVIATLLERHLVKIAGRKQVVGRPFLYATTREFLIRFGLRDLNDLPKMEDMADVLGFEPPSGLADAGPSEASLPLGAGPDPDQTLDVPPSVPED
jgi:segregation and condensation protein B